MLPDRNSRKGQLSVSGKLLGIALRSASRGPMIEVDRAEITTTAGVADDFRGKPGARQVTVLSAEDWAAACAELGKELDWTVRRANLLVEGLTFAETTGARLRVGSVVLQITSETDPCSRMDEACPGLCNALTPNWRGGVCCQVIQGGTIKPGDEVRLENSETGSPGSS